MTDKQKRAAPTIDLTATEVGSTAPGQQAQSDSPPQEGAAKPNDESSPVEDRCEEHAAPAHRNRAGVVATAIIAGLAGAALAMAVTAALWIAGILPGTPVAPNDRSGQIAALQKQVQELQSRPAIATDSQAIEALRQSVRNLEADIAELPPGDKAAAERLAAIDNTMKSLGIALAALTKRIDEIAAKASQAQEHAAATDKAVSDLRTSMLNAKQEAPAAVDSAALDALQKRVAALEQAVDAARAQIGEAAATSKDLRLVLSATALRDAVGSGAPYQAELTRAKTLAADEQVLAPLNQFASDGLPAKTVLAHQLTALMPALRKAAGNAAAAGGFLAHLQANASKLVRIQPVDAPTGDDSSGLLARIEVAARHGDIDAALVDIGKLPEAARQQAAEWVTRAVARQKALAAARRFATRAAGGLGQE
jgi:hypothetical protein